MAGEVVNKTFVHLIKSWSRFKVRVSKPPLLLVRQGLSTLAKNNKPNW